MTTVTDRRDGLRKKIIRRTGLWREQGRGITGGEMLPGLRIRHAVKAVRVEEQFLAVIHIKDGLGAAQSRPDPDRRCL